MRLLLCLLCLASISASTTAPTTQPTPTADYDRTEIEGFTIYINPSIAADDPQVLADVKKLLGVRLYEMKRALPEAGLQKLQHVPIWIEDHDRGFPGMCYHPSRQWLNDHGYNPDKAGGVEIGDARHFLAWSHEQPMMVLHEFCHAYHNLVLGYDYQPIRDAYQNAVDKKLYDNVLRINGHHKRLRHDQRPGIFRRILRSVFRHE